MTGFVIGVLATLLVEVVVHEWRRYRRMRSYPTILPPRR